MNFRNAVLASIASTNTKGKAATLAKAEKHPLLWKALESWTAHRYEKATGQTVAQAGGWQEILDWLLANLPAILAMLMKLFG